MIGNIVKPIFHQSPVSLLSQITIAIIAITTMVIHSHISSPPFVFILKSNNFQTNPLIKADCV